MIWLRRFRSEFVRFGKVPARSCELDNVVDMRRLWLSRVFCTTRSLENEKINFLLQNATVIIFDDYPWIPFGLLTELDLRIFDASPPPMDASFCDKLLVISPVLARFHMSVGSAALCARKNSSNDSRDSFRNVSMLCLAMSVVSRKRCSRLEPFEATDDVSLQS